ncbi:MAG: IS110 family transposase [Candidatus Methanoperedens sp.]|nr:IS110 family transposase [Candidatus Methanoperedens sp.]
MNIRVEKACGIDVHKSFLVATILTYDAAKETKEFNTGLEDLINLRDWLMERHCQRVAIESTGIYWIPVYTCLEGKVETIVANARQIKNMPGRKTDYLDSEWLAEICLNGQIKPSFIPSKEIRELRDLTRTRTKTTQTMTAFKNRVHKVLEKANIRISGVLSELFGIAGLQILNALLDKKNIDEVLKKVKRIGKKKAAIKEAVRGELSQTDIWLIRECLETIDFLKRKINLLDSMINQRIENTKKQDHMQILMSIPGISFTSASAILAEIGDINVFPNPKSLVGWSGLAPSLNESAGKSSNGHITKKGSKYLRRMLVQCAHVIAGHRPNRLRFFFQRILMKKGKKIAIVALARKILSIIHHVLKNNEKYSEDSLKPKQIKQRKFQSISEFSLDEMIEIISRAGYTVDKGS